MKFFKSSRKRSSCGFTLIEIIVVTAIVATILAMTAPVVTGMLQSTRLSGAGRKVASLCGSAGQLAMSRNTLTALLLIGNCGTDADYRAFSLLEYDSAQGWKQKGEWEILPQGVVVDALNALESSFLSTAEDLPFYTNSKELTFAGGGLKIEQCYLRVFVPNGGVDGF